MEDGGISTIIIILALILVNGGLQLSYAALTNHRRTPLRERSEQGDRKAKRTVSLTDDLPRLYVTNQLALTMVRLALIAVALLNLALPLAAGAENPSLVVVGVLVATGLLAYIFGEVIPAALGQAYADQLVGAVTPPIRALTVLLKPLVAGVMAITSLISKLTGSEALAKAVTEEEIIALVDVGQQGGTIEDDEKEMIYSVLQFGETLAREVMVPRPDIVAVEIKEGLNTATRKFLESGHSRMPVFEDEIDNVKGLLYIKDLFKLWVDEGTLEDKSIGGVMRPAYFVPETKRADRLFKEMQERKVHLAVVVDEYGGTAGIVSIEDLVEEIVGDIRDEYDVNEEAEYTPAGANAYIVDGGMNLDDLNELLEIDLPNDENDSIGGYLYSMLGHVPEIGETVEEPGLIMRIDDVENRRIRKVYIAKVPLPQDEEDEKERERDRERANGKARADKADDTDDMVEQIARPAES